MSSCKKYLFSLMALALVVAGSTARASEDVDGFFGKLQRLGAYTFSRPDIVIVLSQAIGNQYGYDADCDDSTFNNLDPRECAIGLRSLYEGLQLGWISQNEELLGVAKITIAAGAHSWAVHNIAWSDLDLTIPYAASSQEIAAFIRYNLYSHSRPNDRILITTLEPRAGVLEKNYGIRVGASSALTPDQIDRGLRLMTTALKRVPKSLTKGKPLWPLEVIELQVANENLHESAEQLVLGLNAMASVDAAAKFITDQVADRSPWIEQFLSDREEYHKIKTSLMQTTAIQIMECGAEDSPSLQNSMRTCLLTAQHIRDAMKTVGGKGQAIKAVRIDCKQYKFSTSADIAIELDGQQTLTTCSGADAEGLATLIERNFPK